MAAALLLTGCTSLDDFARSNGPHPAASTSSTQPATTLAVRLQQSGAEALLGPRPQASVDAAAMVAADRGVPLPAATVDAARAAATAVRRLDPHAPADALLVLVPRDDAQFADFTGRSVGGQLAVTVTRPGRLPFVVLAPRTVRRASTPDARETLVHEAFHALTLARQQTDRPLWLLEGWAEYVGQRTVPQAPHKRADITAHLPSDDELRGSGGHSAADAYYEAFTFARYLRDTRGHAAVMAFYSDAATTTTPLDDLAVRHFGRDLATLEAGYAAWYPSFR